MGKKRTKSTPASRPAAMVFRYLLRLLPLALLLVSAMVAFEQVESFLIHDKRFALGSPERDADHGPAIRLHGIVHCSRARIMKVFAGDMGRSLYLFPTAERRRRLLAVDWVRDASVSRIWPNRVEVHIQERVPVAFVQLPPRRRGRPNRVALIDAEGVILKRPQRARYDFPVLTGIRERQREPARALRVRRAMRLMREAGELGEGISEIDVSNPNKLKVTESVRRHVVTLLVGRRNFRSRLENFNRYYAEIEHRLPAATTFDLRLDDRITALDATTGKPFRPNTGSRAGAPGGSRGTASKTGGRNN